MLEFMGTDATLYLDRGRYEIHPERGKGKPEELVLGTGKHPMRPLWLVFGANPFVFKFIPITLLFSNF